MELVEKINLQLMERARDVLKLRREFNELESGEQTFANAEKARRIEAKVNALEKEIKELKMAKRLRLNQIGLKSA